MGNSCLYEFKEVLPMIWIAIEVLRNHRDRTVEYRFDYLGNEFQYLLTQPLEDYREERQYFCLSKVRTRTSVIRKYITQWLYDSLRDHSSTATLIQFHSLKESV